MMDANPRAVIGGNEPPLKDRLELDHAALLKEATEAATLVPDQIRAIETDEEAADYTDTGVAIKAVIDQADAAFKVEKAPWLTGGRTVDDFFSFRKGLLASVDRVREALDARANRLMAEQRKREDDEAERARVAAAAENERRRKEAEAFDEPPPPIVTPLYVAPVPVKNVARIISMATGNKASTGVKWAYRITDPGKVPRQFLMVNEAAIAAAVKGGTRSIDGVEVFETAKTSLRR